MTTKRQTPALAGGWSAPWVRRQRPAPARDLANELPSDRFDLRHAATDRAIVVVVPERRLLATGGVGSPRGADFKLASDILRLIAIDIRRRLRRDQLPTPRVEHLEATWSSQQIRPEDIPATWSTRSDWHWVQMVEVPSAATDAVVGAAIDEARMNAGRETPLVRLLRIAEGRAAQILHVGGHESEPDTLRRLFEAVLEAGLQPRGPVHQILLADPDVVPTGRAASIFRLPIESV
jgi:hypothetical protein